MPVRRTTRERPPAQETPSGDAPPDAKPTPARITVKVLRRDSGESPFTEWFRFLRDVGAQTRVTTRIDRIRETGNLGDHRERISGAVSELRIDYGSGYRVYFVRYGDTMTLLSVGGTKDGQQGDILRAAALCEECKNDVDRFSGDYVR